MSNEIISNLLKIRNKNIEFGDNIRSEKIKYITYTVVPANFFCGGFHHCGAVNHSIEKNVPQ